MKKVLEIALSVNLLLGDQDHGCQLWTVKINKGALEMPVAIETV
jgi:hypothetical protein